MVSNSDIMHAAEFYFLLPLFESQPHTSLAQIVNGLMSCF